VSTNDVIESIDGYCKRLWKALHKLPAPERDELIREVRSHILERVEAEPEVTTEALTEILRAVGEPKELAAEYRTQAMLREATRGKPPWVLRPWTLLLGTLRWGVKSMAGLVAFLITLVGYGCTAVFLLCALLKPVFPARIGLWLAPQHTLSLGYWNGRLSGTEIYGISVRPPVSFALGTLGSTEGPVRELLGNWLIPVSLLCGAVFFLATSIVARWFIGRFNRKKKWSASRPYATSIRREMRTHFPNAPGS
jgi:HAAS domain-containing protein